jgi:hypothetical protein
VVTDQSGAGCRMYFGVAQAMGIAWQIADFIRSRPGRLVVARHQRPRRSPG